jgi:hypothetical protein
MYINHFFISISIVGLGLEIEGTNEALQALEIT